MLPKDIERLPIPNSGQPKSYGIKRVYAECKSCGKEQLIRVLDKNKGKCPRGACRPHY